MPTPTPGPGPISWVHQLTMGTGLLGAIAYLAFEVMQWRSGSPDGALWRVLVAGAAVIVFVAYLWNLRSRLHEKLTPD